jgi:hypothetical protein
MDTNIFFEKVIIITDVSSRIGKALALNLASRGVMCPGPVAAWLKLLVPGVMDWFTIHTFLKPITKLIENFKNDIDNHSR